MIILIISLCLYWSVERARRGDSRRGARIEQPRTIIVILEDKMDHAPGCGGEILDGPAEIIEDRGLPDNGINSIYTQAIEAIALHPMQRIFNNIGADLLNAEWLACPHGVSAEAKNAGVTIEIIAFAAAVIVNHVENTMSPHPCRSTPEHHLP